MDAALNGGFHLAYLIGAALVGVAIVIAVSVLRSGSPAAAGQDAEPHAEPHADRRRPRARVLRRALSTIIACPIVCISPNPTRPTR